MVSRPNQAHTLGSCTDGRDEASAERQIVRFDSVAEEHALRGHHGFDLQRLPRLEETGDDRGAPALARKRLPDREDETRIAPFQADRLPWSAAGEGADTGGHIENRSEPARQS